MAKKNKYIIYILSVAVVTAATVFIYKRIKRTRQVELEKEESDTEVIEQTSGDMVEWIEENTSYAKTCGTEHFSQSEFDSHDGVKVPDEFKGNVQIVMNNLEVLRAYLNNKPINVNSGYRSPQHNAAVGGVMDSQHVYGKASDIHSDYYTPAEIKQAIENLISQGKMMEGGIGLYKSFVHYDIRGTKARWNG